MRTERIALPATTPGTTSALTVHRFGEAGARPRVYIQAALHADEIPGMLAAHHLRTRLAEAEKAGEVRGEIVLVPFANPLGLAQKVVGQHVGRFDLGDGVNFNRGFPYLAPVAAERIADRLGPDAAANVRTIRAALSEALAAESAITPAQHLKRTLLGLAVEADVVLDLHCDAEAVMHLYTLPSMAEPLAPLSALLGAEAVLVATESGDDPFDEACSRPWHELAEQFPERSIPLGCVATTVELRGGGDVEHALAEADAGAILNYLITLGVVGGEAPQLPEPRCEPTPLAASEPLTAPTAGIVAFHVPVGAKLTAGERVADLIDPETGAVTPVTCVSSGILFARTASRFAFAGQRLGKIAGTTLQRSGKLLSP